MDRPPCKEDRKYEAVDLSIPVHKIKSASGEMALDTFKRWGIKTILRYYDYEKESIKGKMLTLAELREIFARKLSVGVVFQHQNNNPRTFVVGNRGTEDAERALELAKELGQPYGTAIYFGVDGVDAALYTLVAKYKRLNGEEDKGDRMYSQFLKYHKAAFKKPAEKIVPADILPFVERYFDQVSAVFEKKPGGDPKKVYKIGAYGSGLSNFALQRKPFVKYFWLAQSGAWPQFTEYQKDGKWALLQKIPTFCSDWPHPLEKNRLGEPKQVDFDFNMVAPGKTDFGQWSKSTKLR